jgi:hypothetical protein
MREIKLVVGTICATMPTLNSSINPDSLLVHAG